ncbi:DUF2787 family protein [Vibrio parahaemolyticus]|uniref:DUF2787 family protein n=1 Tax=Vibrio parahaemolyticus TaxID=670 RepID=UPI001E58BB13|nr:DUF2787 family protein [Vibrio parahaemolyticus]
MNQFIVSSIRTELVKPMHCFLDALIADNPIPTSTQRVALNIRSTDEHSRFQPIEIQLERQTAYLPWQLRFIATFDVICSETKQKELSLYFNFAGNWFYHPETKKCRLSHPEVQALLSSWLKAISSLLIEHTSFTINLTLIR